MAKSFGVIDWMEAQLSCRACNSEEFFYDEMESQSGFCLPLIYQPFDTARREHWRDRGALFDFLYAVQGEGKRLLDFGPGDGWPSLIVAPYAAEVVGVDGSPKRVAVCTANAARLGIANARFVHVPPGSPLPFPDDFFDGVMAASSIEQTPDPRFVLRELWRVLKPGGRLRMHYEGLGYYAGAQECVAELEARSDASCSLVVYERHVREEYARMARLGLSMSLPEAQAALPANLTPAALYRRLTPARLEQLRCHVMEPRACRLSHPSGRTWLRWLQSAGFGQAQTTYEGARFAGQLFDRIPPDKRPADMAGVDDLLCPVVQIVVQMPTPSQLPRPWDPMITAVKSV